MKVREHSDRKMQILQSAASLFSRQGFQAASMRELAEAVGIEAASIYSHYDSKEKLLEAVALVCAEDFDQSVRPIYSGNLNTRAKLKAMVVAHIEVIARNLESSAVFNTEWRHLKEPALSLYAQRRDQYEAMFRHVVHQGVVENLFRNDDEKFLTLTMLSALNWTAQWYKPGGPYTPTEIGDKLAEILLNGIERHI
jgi:AcrR family transcriptional regulator